MTDTYAVLLAGGSGTRLWPVSRELYPKQLGRFVDSDSLIQGTVRRLEGVLDRRNMRIVCGRSHFAETARHAAAVGLDSEKAVICEPCGRNTAPAILLAVLLIAQEAPQAVMYVFPADHVIKDQTRFHQKLRMAGNLADAGHIVTFGIRPDYPETGYGYIEGAAEGPDGALKIERFVEKPDRGTAEAYLATGRFFWNSGMFAFRADVILAEFERCQPEMTADLKRLAATGDAISRRDYEKLPSVSFDVALMEKTAKGVVLPSDFGWSDIGSWKSLYDFLPKDKNRNVLDGDIVAKDSRRCLVMGRHRLVAINHLEDVVIVETPDSVFVSDMERSRDVKAIVENLQLARRREHRRYPVEHLGWGTRYLLDRDMDHHILRLTVNPHQSLEKELVCGERWHLFLVDGGGCLTVGGRAQDLAGGAARTVEGPAHLTFTNTGGTPTAVVVVQTRKTETD